MEPSVHYSFNSVQVPSDIPSKDDQPEAEVSSWLSPLPIITDCTSDRLAYCQRVHPVDHVTPTVIILFFVVDTGVHVFIKH